MILEVIPMKYYDFISQYVAIKSYFLSELLCPRCLITIYRIKGKNYIFPKTRFQ